MMISLCDKVFATNMLNFNYFHMYTVHSNNNFTGNVWAPGLPSAEDRKFPWATSGLPAGYHGLLLFLVFSNLQMH